MSKCWVQCAVLVKVISIDFRVEKYIAFKEKYTMHNKFSNFLCFGFFVLIFVQCRSILIAMNRTGLRQVKPRNFRRHPLNRH